MDEVIAALGTQYQIRGDAILPRHSKDAPTLSQLGLIRLAHYNVRTLLKEFKALKLEVERLKLVGHNCD